MSSASLSKRQFHAFLSHAHADKVFVDQLDDWLHEVAGLRVWYDSRHLAPSSSLAVTLASSIGECRGMIIVLSQDSVSSGWVREEFEAAIAQRTQIPRFRIIPIRIDDCEVPGFLQTTKLIEAPNGHLDAAFYDQLLAAFYSADLGLDPQRARDVYVSRSWRVDEAAFPDTVCRAVMGAGFRLIGDSLDQTGFSEERVRSIMSSCGAVVAIPPDRGNGTTSKYVLKEIEIGRSIDLPCLIAAHPGIALPQEWQSKTVRLPSLDGAEVGALEQAVLTLDDEWRSPRRPHFVFFAADFDPGQRPRNERVKSTIQRVTAMACIVGDEIREPALQETIRQRIADAELMIADISGEKLNTCIEAGIALGAGTTVHLVSEGPRRSPPFMFRDKQVWYYADEGELLGLVHRLVYPYRRRALNSELDV